MRRTSPFRDLSLVTGSVLRVVQPRQILAVGADARVLERLGEALLDPRVQAVLTGTDGQVLSAADAVELETVDYVADPLQNLSNLLAAVGIALGSRRGDAQLRYLKEREASSTWDVFGVLKDRMAEQVDAARHPAGAPDLSG